MIDCYLFGDVFDKSDNFKWQVLSKQNLAIRYNITQQHHLVMFTASSSTSFLALFFSPSLPPAFSHVCSMGARARSTAGAALTPSDVCVRLWRSLINTGTGMAKLTSPASSLALSQGFQALQREKRKKKKGKTLLHPSAR